MTITRIYYEDLLDLFDELSKSSSKGIVSYFKIKKKLITLLKKIENFNLLNLNLSEGFITKLNSTEESEIDYERIDLLTEIYGSLLNTSIDKDHFSKEEPNYLKSLELSLINLNHSDYIGFCRICLKTTKN